VPACDQATIAALDGDFQTAGALLTRAQMQWDEQGVVADPDDAAEIADLRRRLIEAGVKPRP
jgi:hypothetical protein